VFCSAPCFNLAVPPGWPAVRNQIDAYLICATPRTGSSLLCGLLDSTGIAGHPESYFRAPSEQEWAACWGIAGPSDGRFSYAGYLQAAITAGSTGNGVFAARIMWGTLGEVAAKLAPVYPDLAGPDLALLNRAFGRTRFVYLFRRDVVAQAVSLLRAEQTNVWFETGPARHEPEQEPRFDLDQIQERVQLIEEHNTAWRQWFTSARIQPHLVQYEDLAATPISVARGVLSFLGLQLPAGREITVQHRRLADDLNAQWIDRYRLQDPGWRKRP
jgi:trehalose 2-sulfotransferase